MVGELKDDFVLVFRETHFEVGGQGRGEYVELADLLSVLVVVLLGGAGGDGLAELQGVVGDELVGVFVFVFAFEYYVDPLGPYHFGVAFNGGHHKGDGQGCGVDLPQVEDQLSLAIEQHDELLEFVISVIVLDALDPGVLHGVVQCLVLVGDPPHEVVVQGQEVVDVPDPGLGLPLAQHDLVVLSQELQTLVSAGLREEILLHELDVVLLVEEVDVDPVGVFVRGLLDLE